MTEYVAIAEDVQLGAHVKLAKFINLYGCIIGENTKIGAFVEVQKHAVIGKNCKISSHTFICEGVTIGNNCFIGHGVMFINDNHPRATTPEGKLETEQDWAARFVRTIIADHVAIGSNATILGGISIGTGATVGAGSVVTKDVPAGVTVAGNLARIIKKG